MPQHISISGFVKAFRESQLTASGKNKFSFHFNRFKYFLADFARFLRFGKIQKSKIANRDDSHTEMATRIIPSRDVIRLLRTYVKETFSDVLSTLQVSLS